MPTATLPADPLAHPECRSLYAAICAEPDEDTNRLAAADWLEANGFGERAEFIRVQVELARREIKFGDRHVAWKILERKRKGAPVRWNAKTVSTLIAHEIDLLERHEAEFRGRRKCEQVLWGSCGDDCPDCHGTGFTGTLGEKIVYHDTGKPTELWRYPVEWSRGYPYAVTAPLADFWVGEKPTKWARALVREHGTVMMLGVRDRHPDRDTGTGPHQGESSYDWGIGDVAPASTRRYRLPEPVFNEVRKLAPHVCMAGPYAEFPSPAAATSALARALCGLCRG